MNIHLYFNNIRKLIFILSLLYIYLLIGNDLYDIKKKRPKISIFLPIYNKENFLINSIKSLQIQTLKDIEIVAVNDCSTDRSLEILTNLSKNDSRIKVVNNDKNHGLLYSRAMGILNSSGEYLVNLDPDDMINGQDTLEFLYNKAKFDNLDIISFNVWDQKHKRIIKCIEKNNIIRQPKLFSSIFRNNRIREFIIYNKLIKKEIFLSAYEDFKDKIYNGKWNYFEDNIWNILVNKYAQSRLCINRMVYIYTYNKNSLMNDKYGYYQFQNLIYRHEMYEKLFTSKNDQKYLIGEYYYLLNKLRSKIKSLLLLNEKSINDQIIYIFKLFLNKNNVSISTTNNINDFLNRISIK
jgi:glycosyltransferase involved in cell wall biosynthesis